LIRIIYLNSAKSNLVSINKDVLEVLGIKDKDEILYVIKNGILYARKFDGIIKSDEKYVSSSTIGFSSQSFKTRIPYDVLRAINVETDILIWAYDENNNIFLRNTVLMGKCSKELFHEEISALIINASTLTEQNQLTIPADIIDILGLFEHDIIYLSFDKLHTKIILSKESNQDTIQEIRLHCRKTYS
jgi:bifunctional DNA-binding transcriptional regulator/antitoxin component of YhaV-PrlF toxin-antitoxin module